MKAHNKNLPAFPLQHGGLGCDGMTLRDYFAAAALPSLLANPNLFEGIDFVQGVDEAVQDAYQIAEAMLIAKEVYENV